MSLSIEGGERQTYRNRLLERVKNDPDLALDAMPRDSMYAYLLRVATEDLRVPAAVRSDVMEDLLNDWYDFGPLQSAMDDPYVTDITVAGPFATILKRADVGNYASAECRFSSEDDIRAFLDRKFDGTPYHFSLAMPMTDGILPGGARIHVIGGPSTRWTVQEGDRIYTEPCTIVSIRKPLYPFTLAHLRELGMMDRAIEDYLRLVVRLGDSFVVCGGVSSGKTTVMNGMTGEIPKGQKTVIVEEQAEMTPLCQWALRLTDRESNNEHVGTITMAMNIKSTLRMDADNLIVGEARDATIVHQFIRSLLLVKRMGATTFHTHVDSDNPIPMALLRLLLEATEGRGREARMIQSASLIAGSLRHIITTRDTERGKRITEIGEIVAMDHENDALLWQPVFRYDYHEDTWHGFGLSVGMRQRADVAGIGHGYGAYVGELNRLPMR